jgi:hypothetical protein
MLTDDCIHIGDHGRPPRLLVVVRGMWVPDGSTIPGSFAPAGVCGVSLGVSIAEHVTAPDGWLYDGGAHETCVSGVAAPLAWRDLRREEIRAILNMLSALGLPAREPDINGITDTSDYEHVTTLVGVIDRRPFRVCVERMCSGYGGRNAQAFALLMRVVLGIAGLDADASHWRSLLDAAEQERQP